MDDNRNAVKPERKLSLFARRELRLLLPTAVGL